jgi:DNA-binding response OmpR family regulator
MADVKKEIKLLLVDDEEDFRLAASRALGRQGFSVLPAESGERALQLLRSEQPDVVVLDLRMEGMDGISTLEEIRKTSPDLPVIILTGHGRYEDALAGIKLKVIDFVQKPVDMQELGDHIRGFFAQEKRIALHEKTISELMVPASRYRRVYVDQPLREVVDVLREAIRKPSADAELDRGRRTLLVFDRRETFVGLIRAEDIVRVMIPQFLLESPYSSYFTGMFLAQAKVVGKLPIDEIVRRHPGIDTGAPLMEALHLMIVGHLSHLPVLQKGELVGLLRPEDLFKEIASPILG